MSSLSMLSDRQLIDAYEQSVLLGLDNLFIELLKNEIDRREIDLYNREAE